MNAEIFVTTFHGKLVDLGVEVLRQIAGCGRKEFEYFALKADGRHHWDLANALIGPQGLNEGAKLRRESVVQRRTH